MVTKYQLKDSESFFRDTYLWPIIEFYISIDYDNYLENEYNKARQEDRHNGYLDKDGGYVDPKSCKHTHFGNIISAIRAIAIGATAEKKPENTFYRMIPCVATFEQKACAIPFLSGAGQASHRLLADIFLD